MGKGLGRNQILQRALPPQQTTGLIQLKPLTKRQIPRKLQAIVRHQFVATNRRCTFESNPDANWLCSGICTSAVETQLNPNGTKLASNHGSREPQNTSTPAVTNSANINGATTHVIRRVCCR